MRSKLFLLSTVVLLGISSVGYGKLYPRDGIPQSDCLEMICASGICMEDDEGRGSCCPKKENLPKFNESCTECGCFAGPCVNGKCGCKTDSDCFGELICRKSDFTCECPNDRKSYINTEGMMDCCPETSKLPQNKGEHCQPECGCSAESFLICDKTELKCACPENYGWDDMNKKCLPYCKEGEEFGAIFIIDRSGSTAAHNNRYAKKINAVLKKLTLYPNIYYAVFEEDKSLEGWKRLSWKKLNKTDSVKKIFKDYKTGDSTVFSKAFKEVKNICSQSKQVKIVYFLITDGKVQRASSLNAIDKAIDSECKNATFVLISAETNQIQNLYPDKTCEIDGDLSDCIDYFNNAVEREICIQR